MAETRSTRITYRVGNNTDYAGNPFVTRNRREAERVWRKLRPRKDAGNLYTAFFRSTCPECGETQDETVDAVTCRCAG